MILQTEASECGLAYLAMVANHHGQQVEMTGAQGPPPYQHQPPPEG